MDITYRHLWQTAAYKEGIYFRMLRGYRWSLDSGQRVHHSSLGIPAQFQEAHLHRSWISAHKLPSAVIDRSALPQEVIQNLQQVRYIYLVYCDYNLTALVLNCYEQNSFFIRHVKSRLSGYITVYNIIKKCNRYSKEMEKTYIYICGIMSWNFFHRTTVSLVQGI